jgi:hypothetical protein
MNDFRMMIFIEEYIGDALKKGRSEKFCIKKLNDYLEPPMLQLRRVCHWKLRPNSPQGAKKQPEEVQE